MEPLKYLNTFWGTLEMSLINCKISLILTWSASFVISNATVNQATTFTITDTKLYVLVVTLSIDDNAKLLQQLNQDSNAQLTGIDMKQKQNTECSKPTLWFFNQTKFSWSN